jgi:hypothetical protein
LKAGDKVRVSTENGDTRDGVLLLCSPNEDSLMVKLADGFPIRAGLYIDFMPLLRTKGVYRELVTNEAVEVHEVS